MANNGKNGGPEVYEFTFKDERIHRANLKISNLKSSSFGCVSREGEIIIIGGKNHEKAQNIVECYKYLNNELIYSKMPNLIQARFDHSSCIGFDSRIYTLGGITLNNDATNAV